MPDIHEQYERELRKRMAAINNRIKKTYEKGISEIQVTVSTVKYKGTPFALKDYPALQKKIETVSKQMHSSIYATTVNSIKDSWDLSNKKNNVLADKRLSGTRVPKQTRQVIYDPNKGALDSFIKRKEGGLNLSDRIWNSLDPFKKEMEQTIGLGIGEGKPAAEIAKDAKKYLNEPDKLFRRVRGEDGKLHLSQAARDYHPGQGVYRSSYKNAMRVARTETNDAYRSSDHERWSNMEFITGIEVKLSNAHPKYDICDSLTGQYPKEFKFRGWHPQCICYAVPKIMGDDEFEKLEDQILAGEPVGINSKDLVTKPPKGFTDYLGKNRERIAGWKNEPYWMKDNPDYVKIAKNKTVPKPKQDATPPAPGSLQPSGNKIAPQFTDISASVKKPVRDALTKIDSVHGDGLLDNIPFQKQKRKMPKGVQATFESTPDGKPARITLTNNAGSPEISIVHEMGHFLDLQAIGEKNIFNSTVKNSPVSKVLAVAEKSDKIKGLRKMLEDGYFEKDGTTIPISWDFEKHLQYLLNPKEVWARSYAQFIAKRSGSQVMQKGIDDLVEIQKRIPHKYQWEGSDFDDIEKAIEEMMIEIGWISR